MNALTSLKELVSSVAHPKGSAGARRKDAPVSGSPTQNVDEQIARLVDTIEAEELDRSGPARDAVEPRTASTAGTIPSDRGMSRTGAAHVIRPFRRRLQPVLLYVAVILLGVGLGLLIGALLGR